jgi:hypothetical protein
MSPELTADQVMGVIAAWEAAWADDSGALVALMRGGQGEQSSAVLVAQYSAGRVQSMLLVVTGIAGMDGADRQRALAELRQSLVSHMTTMALRMMSGWARNADDDIPATRDLARHVLQAILSLLQSGHRSPRINSTSPGRPPPTAPTCVRVGAGPVGSCRQRGMVSSNVSALAPPPQLGEPATKYARLPICAAPNP